MDPKNWKRDRAQKWPGATLSELGPADHEIKSSRGGLLLRWQHGQAIKSTIVSRALQHGQAIKSTIVSRALQHGQAIKSTIVSRALQHGQAIKSTVVSRALQQHGQAIKSTVVSRTLQQLAEQSNLSRALQQQQKLKQYLYCYCCISHSKSTSQRADNKNNMLFIHKFLSGGCKEEAVAEQDSRRWSGTAQGEDSEEPNLLSRPTVT